MAVSALVLNDAVLKLFQDRHLYHRPFSNGRWRVGERLRIRSDLALEPYAHVHAGYDLPVEMGSWSYARSPLRTNLHIGRYCSIGADITWLGDDHPFEWASSSPFSYDPFALQGVKAYLVGEAKQTTFPLKKYDRLPNDVILGNDVWIGDGAFIAGGVTIGHGAVVAAGAIVTRDVAPYMVVAGSPAKVIKQRFPDALIERFLAAEWWRYGLEILQPLKIENPGVFLDQFEALGLGVDKEFTPTRLTFAELVAAANPDEGSKPV